MVTLSAVLAVTGAFVAYQHSNPTEEEALPIVESHVPSSVLKQETVVTIPPEIQEQIELPEPAPEEEIVSLKLNYLEEQNLFELPLQGASAYASVAMNLRESPNGSKILEIQEGEGFTIVEDQGEWWLVAYQGVQGYVYANYCLLNLPDVIPSAIYANTNASESGSVFQSSYYPLEGVTGETLYEAYEYNERLGKEEYTMVILYQTARKIAQVQRTCLANGETLIINETYRPYQTQRQVVNAMTSLSKSNATVLEGITKPPWSISWFISTGISNHQLGFAIDTSLGKVLATEERISGDYVYQVVTDYVEFPMPTPIHELSYHSASKDMEYTTIEVPRAENPEQENLEQENPEQENPEQENPEQENPEQEIPEQEIPEQEEPTYEEELPLPSPETIVPEVEALPSEEVLLVPELLPEAEVIRSITQESTSGQLLQALSYGLQFLSEEEPIPEEVLEEDPLMETITTSKWITAETMTEAAIRLQGYFVAVGMEPIGSEWWHFNDFSNKGPGNAHRDYYIQGIYSQEPWVLTQQ